jgi:plastocyanin
MTGRGKLPLRRWIACSTVILIATLAGIGSARSATLVTTVTGTDGAPVPQVVVHALPLNGRLPATPPKASQMDQVDKEFVPFVQPVQLGAAVTFPNKDNIRHHVYSFSAAKTFELKLYSGTSAKPVVFDKPGPVALGCNIHDWMVGHLYVVEGPWFTKTGRDGKGGIDLPAGEYVVRAWHPWMKDEPAPVRIRVEASGELQAAFRIALTPPPATTHDKR